MVDLGVDGGCSRWLGWMVIDLFSLHEYSDCSPSWEKENDEEIPIFFVLCITTKIKTIGSNPIHKWSIIELSWRGHEL